MNFCWKRELFMERGAVSVECCGVDVDDGGCSGSGRLQGEPSGLRVVLSEGNCDRMYATRISLVSF